MPRSDASILRQRQVRMYRAARSLVAMRVCLFTWGLMALSFSISTLLAIAFGELFESSWLPPSFFGLSASPSPDRPSAVSLVDGGAASLFMVLSCVFWPRLLLAFTLASEWIRNRLGTQANGQRRPALPVRRRHALHVVADGMFIVLYALGAIQSIVFLILFWNRGHNTLAFPLLYALAYFGASSLAVGLLVTRGRSRRCASCSYSLTSWHASANLCPECGNPWKRLGGTIYGTRLHSAWLLSGVALLLAAASVWAFVPV